MPSATAPTNAGTYQVTASFAGNANYTTASNAASITINKATRTIAYTGLLTWATAGSLKLLDHRDFERGRHDYAG